MKKAITYYRVSTVRQGESGLGIDAQIKAVRDFAKAHDYTLEKEYVEVESGKNNSRPILQKALYQCKRKHFTLLVAKLDRMSRNVSFIADLLESGIEFKAVDVPGGEKFVVHILAAVAEHEREQISKRTILALREAKARGVALGTYGRDVLSKKNKELSHQFAGQMQPLIAELMQDGFLTVRAITDELNRQHVPTYRNDGSKWHVSTVHRLLNQASKHLSICINTKTGQRILPATKKSEIP
jgi:DNA invertase Pin-like site-specific DNA recombinase|nr:recombinase family protein [uncultured Flavobacterium sp.]